MKSYLLLFLLLCLSIQADEEAKKRILELNHLMNSHDDFSVVCKMTSHTDYDEAALKKKYKELFSVFALNMQDSKEEFLCTAKVKDRVKFVINVKQISSPRPKLGIKRNAEEGELPVQISAKDKSSRAFSDGENIYSEHLSADKIFHVTFAKNKDVFNNEKLYGLFVSFPFSKAMFVKDNFKSQLEDKDNTFSMKGNEVIIKRKGLVQTLSFDDKGYIKKIIYDMTELTNSIHSMDMMTQKEDKNLKPVIKAVLIFDFTEWSHEVNEEELKVVVVLWRSFQYVNFQRRAQI